ncbi:MAG: class I SAM-dependent methyltransferase, partial [Candidatus Pacearchaeota archaeon]|nr:class I SAM-dependent methyltransferase [Candidatus Pacearchaeota archaeon]
NKIILDVGVGNGKFAKILAPSTKRYIGIDISKEQLERAKIKTKKMNNVRLLLCSADKIPLSSESVDIVFASWAFSTIKNISKLNSSLKEAERILKKQGKIYLVENFPRGEFEKIRDYRPDYITHRKNRLNWLKKNKFKQVKIIDTYFKFDSIKEAQRVLGDIWGEETRKRIKKEIINISPRIRGF